MRTGALEISMIGEPDFVKRLDTTRLISDPGHLCVMLMNCRTLNQLSDV